MYSFWYQRFIPSQDILNQITPSLLPKGVIESKKRIWKDWISRRVETLLSTPDWVKKRSYLKYDNHYPHHTKFELDREETEVSKDDFYSSHHPSVSALVIPIAAWTDVDLKRKFELVARLYTEENLWIVLLAIQIALEEGDFTDEIHDSLEIDFRESLKRHGNSDLWIQLAERSRSLKDGSDYHDNKLAKFPASNWINRPSSLIMTKMNEIIQLNQDTSR